MTRKNVDTAWLSSLQVVLSPDVSLTDDQSEPDVESARRALVGDMGVSFEPSVADRALLIFVAEDDRSGAALIDPVARNGYENPAMPVTP